MNHHNVAALSRMISGYAVSQVVYATAKLGIAELLSAGPRHVDDLAAATKTRPELLFRMLRAAASIGLFTEDDTERNERVFSLAPLGELLRPDVENSQLAFALMMGEEHYYVYGRLLETLRTGENAFEQLYGMPIFQFLSEHPDKGRTFDSAMTSIHGRETAAVLDAYDFSGIGVLADVGGGNGSKLIAILQRHPSLRGILYDLPQVVERAAPRIAAAGLSDRCRLVSGDFFQDVPAGADAYLMRHIIHDWDDEKSLTILRNCHRAMQPGGKLLLVESVIPAGNEPFGAKFLDLTMMLIPGGLERTERQFHELYAQAGFELTRIVATQTEISVLEGIKK
ncbi:MAG: methyltransferase [Planctomycetia bacterium]|nr:methyltransferase [Planctomycetia bacterium]